MRGPWRSLLGVLLSLALAFGAMVAVWLLSRSRVFQFFGRIVPRVETREKLLALTFDDGPLPGTTKTVLATLARYGVRATFYVTGQELELNPEAARDLVAAGHELGNHTYSHRRMVLVTPAFVATELERTDRLIRQAGYRGEITFRPPYGKKLLALPLYLARHGRTTVTWDVEPDSYPAIARDPAEITRYVLTHVRPGSIILLHVMYPGGEPDRQALGGVISGLQRDGYRFLTVSELLRH